MKVAVFQETYPGERRVALVPKHAGQLIQAGIEVQVQQGAGQQAGFPDEQYAAQGAELVADRSRLFEADLLLHVRAAGANPDQAAEDLSRVRAGTLLLGMCDPLGAPQVVQQVAETGAGLFALELIPRITRAQAMDVLSSQATVAGYRAALLAALELPKLFPMLMTAAGTLAAARVLVLGAGVAGLQAIATARRLGAIVSAYDVRPATREQVESLGAKYVQLELQTELAEDQGGYARALSDDVYQQQRQLLAEVVAEQDVVISTAAIPGKPSPLLVTADAVERMAPGSVIVDLAAERGGNCELSEPDQRLQRGGVVILGPTNLPSEVPCHASQMFSNNVTRFIQNLVQDGQLKLNLDDEIIRETLICQQGRVTDQRIRELLGLEALELNSTGPEPEPEDPAEAEGNES